MATKKTETRKRPGGRLIASWKQKVLSQEGTNEELAERFNELAKDHDYHVTAEKIAEWKQSPGKEKARRGQNRTPEGEAFAVLRDLVRLLGKEQVKRLVDGL